MAFIPTRSQLYILQALRDRDWPADLLPWMLSRCGTSPAEWSVLAEQGWVELTGGRWLLAKAGRRGLATAKKTRHDF